MYNKDCDFPAKSGLEWWMGVVAVLLVLLLASLIYLGIKAYQRRSPVSRQTTANVQNA